MIGQDPPVFADVAHNPAGARALAASLCPGDRGSAGDRRDWACLPTRMPQGCWPNWPARLKRPSSPVCPGSPRGLGQAGARAWDPEELQGLAGQLGLEAKRPGPRRALERAREMALEKGGAVIITGSHFLSPDEGAGFQGLNDGQGLSEAGAEGSAAAGYATISR